MADCLQFLRLVLNNHSWQICDCLIAFYSSGGPLENAEAYAALRNAGGMTLSSLVPATVNFISALAKSSVTSFSIWVLHGLLLTIEAAGLSYVSHVQPSDAASGGHLINNPSGVRSSGGSTSAQHANIDVEPTNDLDVD